MMLRYSQRSETDSTFDRKSALVAHNSPFDESCLKAVFRVYQMDYPDYKFYDTLSTARRTMKGLRITSCTPLQQFAAINWITIIMHWPMQKPALGLPGKFCKMKIALEG